MIQKQKEKKKKKENPGSSQLLYWEMLTINIVEATETPI